MKILWTLKKVFGNYRALLMLLILGIILYFAGNFSFHSFLAGFIDSFKYNNFRFELASKLLFLIFRGALSIASFVIIISGVLNLYKKSMAEDSVSMMDFLRGVKDNWLKTLTGSFFIVVTMGVIVDIIRQLLRIFVTNNLRYMIPEIFALSIMSMILNIINMILKSAVIFGILVVIENGNIKDLFSKTFKFLFSKSTLKLYLMILVVSLILTPIVTIITNSFYQLSMGPGTGINSLPIGLAFILYQSIVSTLFYALIIGYTCKLFYEKKNIRSEKDGTV